MKLFIRYYDKEINLIKDETVNAKRAYVDNTGSWVILEDNRKIRAGLVILLKN